MRVLLACTDDWANVGGAMLMHAPAMGDDVEMYGVKRNAHVFNYTDEMPLTLSLNNRSFDILHILHSDVDVLKWAHEVGITYDKLVIQHGGSRFRQHSREINDWTFGKIDGALYETPDLGPLVGTGDGISPLHWLPPTSLRPTFRADDTLTTTEPPIIIGHYPSNPP